MSDERLQINKLSPNIPGLSRLYLNNNNHAIELVFGNQVSPRTGVSERLNASFYPETNNPAKAALWIILKAKFGIHTGLLSMNSVPGSVVHMGFIDRDDLLELGNRALQKLSDTPDNTDRLAFPFWKRGIGLQEKETALSILAKALFTLGETCKPENLGEATKHGSITTFKIIRASDK